MKKYYDKIKKVIKKRNLTPKAVSLLLAIILWAYVSKEKVNLAGNYNAGLEPENAKILVEKKITRKVKVVPEFKGTAKDGFIMSGQVKCIPEYITIDGPLSIINNIGVIYTESIDIDGQSETFSRDINIRKVHEDNVNYSISQVNITVPIIDYSETAFITVPIVIKNERQGYNYLLISDKVEIQILKKDKEYIQTNSLSAYIDCNEINFDNEEFISQSKITAIGFVHVIADSLKIENIILSSIPVTAEIVVTKE